MERTYKVPISTYFGLGLFFAALAFLCLVLPCIFASPPRPFLQVVLLLALAVTIPAVVIWWLSRFHITITPTTLTYSGAFFRGQTIQLSDIRRSGVIIRRGVPGFSQPLLEVETSSIRLRIHYKVFSHEARKDLFQVVGA